MGEPQTPHFYDFGISEPVTKPQSQLFLSLDTPEYLKKKQENPGTFFKYHVCKSRDLGNPFLTISPKTGTEQ